MVAVGMNSLQMCLSPGKVHVGPGVRHSGLTPHRTARDKQLLDLALDTEGFNLARLGTHLCQGDGPARCSDVPLLVMFLHFIAVSGWWLHVPLTLRLSFPVG